MGSGPFPCRSLSAAGDLPPCSPLEFSGPAQLLVVPGNKVDAGDMRVVCYLHNPPMSLVAGGGGFDTSTSTLGVTRVFGSGTNVDRAGLEPAIAPAARALFQLSYPALKTPGNKSDPGKSPTFRSEAAFKGSTGFPLRRSIPDLSDLVSCWSAPGWSLTSVSRL